MLRLGEVHDGLRYLGGDPQNPESWEESQEFHTPISYSEASQSDLATGAVHGLKSLKATSLGAVGLVGDTFGIDRMRDWGIEGYQDTMASMEADSRPQYTYEGVEGFGDAVDFTQYWLGYGAANIAAGLGSGAITAMGVKKLSQKAIEQGVQRYVAGKAAQGHVRNEAQKQFAENLIRKELTDKAVKRGFMGGMAPQAFIQELGATYGEAVSKAEADGRSLDDLDLPRIWGFGTAAGATEFAADLLTAGALKIGPLKDAVGNVGRIPRAVGLSQAEGLTEVTQTGLEEMGAGATFDEANFSDPTSYFAGMIPGGAVGLIRGKAAPADPRQPTDLLDANTFAGPGHSDSDQTAMRMRDEATAGPGRTPAEQEALRTARQNEYMGGLAPNTQGELFGDPEYSAVSFPDADITPAVDPRQAQLGLIPTDMLTPASEGPQQTIDRLTGIGQKAGNTRKDVQTAIAEPTGMFLHDERQQEVPMDMGQRYAQLASGDAVGPAPVVDANAPVTIKALRDVWGYLRNQPDAAVDRAPNKTDMKFFNKLKGKTAEDIAGEVVNDPQRQALVEFLANAPADAPVADATPTVENLQRWGARQRRYLQAKMENPDASNVELARIIGVDPSQIPRLANTIKARATEALSARGLTPEALMQDAAARNQAAPTTQGTTAQENEAEINAATGTVDVDNGLRDGTPVIDSPQDSQILMPKTEEERASEAFLDAADATSKTNMAVAQKAWTNARKQYITQERSVGNPIDVKNVLTWHDLGPEQQATFSSVVASGQATPEQLADMVPNALREDTAEITPEGTVNETAVNASKNWARANKLLSVAGKGTVDQQLESEQVSLLNAINKSAEARDIADRYDAMDAAERSEVTPHIIRLINSIRNGAQYRREGAGKGVSADKLASWVSGPVKKLGSWVQVEVVQDVQALPEGPHPDDVAGAVIGGKVYLVADNITSRRDALTTLAHEAVGHVGLEQMLGAAEFTSLVNSIGALKKSNRGAIADVLKKLQANYVDADGNYTLDATEEAREVMAHLAESNPDFGLVRRVVAKIRLWLAKVGLGDLESATLNKLLVDAATLTQSELGSSTAQTVTKDAYARTGDLAKTASRYENLMANVTRDVIRGDTDAQIEQHTRGLREYAGRVRDTGLPWAERLSKALESQASAMESDRGYGANVEVFRRFILDSGNAKKGTGRGHGLSTDNVYILDEQDIRHPETDELGAFTTTAILDIPLGPFKNGFVMRLAYAPNTARGSVSDRTDNVVMSLTPLEHAENTLGYNGSFDPRYGLSVDHENAVAALTMSPHQDMIIDADALAIMNSAFERAGKPQRYTAEDFANTLDVQVYGPDMESKVAQQYLESNPESFETHTSQWGEEYIRFTAMEALTRPLGRIAHRVLYLGTAQAGVSFPGTFSYRVTGGNEYDMSTGTGKLPAAMNPKQVQRAYRRKGLSAVVEDTAERFAGDIGVKAYNDLSNVLRTAKDSTKFLHQFIRDAKNKIPSADRWYKTVLEASKRRKEILSEAEDIAVMARNLDKKRLDAVNKFIGDSTFTQKWGYDPKFPDRSVVVDRATAQKFNQLDAEQQAVVKSVFAYSEQMTQRKQALSKQLGIDEDFFGAGRIEGPYAPLKRFGNYVAVLKSGKLMDAEAAAEESGDMTEVEKLRSDADHYVVSYFDSDGEAALFARKNRGKYRLADHFEKNRLLNDNGGPNHAVLANVLKAIKADGNSNIPTAVQQRYEQIVKDMYFHSLDEHNARLQGLRRLGRAGYEEDMMKSFVEHAKAEAAFVTNMEFGAETNDAFIKAQKETKNHEGEREYQDILNMVSHHYADMLDYRETPIQDRLTAIATVWLLTTSVGYHLTNATQPIMATIPRLAADFGNYSGAWEALRAGYKIAKQVVSFDVTRLQASIDVDKAPAHLQALLEETQLMGVLDVGMEEDLSNFSRTKTGYKLVDDTTGVMSKVTHKLYQVARLVEAYNRVATVVAANNMAQKNPAVANKLSGGINEYAINMVQDTQGNFSRTDAPLVLKKLPKITGQYRKYQLMMAWLYSSAFKQAFAGESPEIKAMGKRMLGFKLFHASMAAGVLGLPLMNIVAIVADMFIGDDDEPFDMERSLRDMIGDEALADLLLKGPIGHLTGLDLSAKLAEDKIFSIAPYADFDFTTKEGMAKAVFDVAAGPIGGVATKMVDGIGYLEDGEPYKAVEKFMPKGGATAMEAYRLATEGYSRRNGDIVVDPDDIASLLLVPYALGIPIGDLRNIKWTRSQQFQIEDFYREKSNALRQAYVKAHKANDTAEMREIMRKWQDLQSGKDRVRKFFNNSPKALRRQPVSVLVQAPVRQREREREYRTYME